MGGITSPSCHDRFGQAATASNARGKPTAEKTAHCTHSPAVRCKYSVEWFGACEDSGFTYYTAWPTTLCSYLPSVAYCARNRSSRPPTPQRRPQYGKRQTSLAISYSRSFFVLMTYWSSWTVSKRRSIHFLPFRWPSRHASTLRRFATDNPMRRPLGVHPATGRRCARPGSSSASCACVKSSIQVQSSAVDGCSAIADCRLSCQKCII